MLIFLGPMKDESPGNGLRKKAYDAIVEMFPRTGFVQDVRGIFVGYFRNKPGTTYENVAQSVGERYVERDSARGHT